MGEKLLDSILRALTKAFATLHYKWITSKQLRSYVPPSGKCIGTAELHNMIDASLDSWLTTGRFNDEFELKLAKYMGVKYALTVNSGSSANLLAISALTSYTLKEKRIKPGDEVITVAAGFPTTVAPIIQNRAVPVFVDVDVATHNILVDQLRSAISPKTKAIMVAHTLGNPFNLDEILAVAKEHDLWVIEDNCDALGATYRGQKTGSFGHISTVSFYPAHHITMGEGGAVLTSDIKLQKVIQSFRDWGRDCWCPPGKDNTCQCRFGWKLGLLPKGYDHKYIYSHVGYNLKITDWQAAIGVAQLDRIDEFVEARRYNYAQLIQRLNRFSTWLTFPEATPQSNPSWFGFLITVKEDAPFEKLKLVEFLEANNVGTRQLFSGNLLRHPGFVQTEYDLRIQDSEIIRSTDLSETHFARIPNTDVIMSRAFWIGIWPGVKTEALDQIESAFDAFFETI